MSLLSPINRNHQILEAIGQALDLTPHQYTEATRRYTALAHSDYPVGL